MKYLFRMAPIALIGILGTILIAIPVEAARLGGGQNLGKQTSPAQTFQTLPHPAAASPVAATTAASGASRWLGPLAGLAAGGILGALFFGGAFNGLQIMDVVILIGMAAGIFFLIRALRGRSHSVAQPSPMAWAPVGGQGASVPGSVLERDFDRTGGTGGMPLPTAQDPRISGFDQEQFLADARAYFVQMQAAWDAYRMNEIREFVTPELFQILSEERAKVGHQENITEVHQLNVEMQTLRIENHQIIASVRFSGLIREGAGENPRPFRELWHIERYLNPPSSTWFIAGIQQET